jgi:hypothetical protein
LFVQFSHDIAEGFQFRRIDMRQIGKGVRLFHGGLENRPPLGDQPIAEIAKSVV